MERRWATITFGVCMLFLLGVFVYGASKAAGSNGGEWVLVKQQTHVHKKHHARARARGWLKHVPDRFVASALCVHDGWHHAVKWPNYPRTWNVPDSIYGGTGEAGWHESGGAPYNGMQFYPSTWRRAGGKPWRIVSASPAEQIFRTYVIVVRQDHGSWHEWPNTARACGLR